MKTGILGCGTIAATYLQALAQPDAPLHITALYDLLPENAQKYAAPGRTVCHTLEQLLCTDIQCVIISTPLDTHTQLAEQCLRARKHVLMEKPATLSVAELTALYALAEEMGVVFHVAFHAAFGLDIEWYLAHEAALGAALQMQNICRVECGFFDPYMPAGEILEDRRPLGGSCVDSGVNILSVCSRLLPLSQLSLRSHTQKVRDGVVYSSETLYEGGGKQLLMHTGWDRGINHKSTLLHFAGTQDRLLLDHSDQAVWLLPADGSQVLLFRETDLPRMVNQYIGVFRRFSQLLNTDDPAPRRQTLIVHDKLVQATNGIN